MLYQLLHQLGICLCQILILGNTDVTDLEFVSIHKSLIFRFLTYQLIYSPCIIVSLVHILKCTFVFLALLNNLIKTNVIAGIVTVKCVVLFPLYLIIIPTQFP